MEKGVRLQSKFLVLSKLLSIIAFTLSLVHLAPCQENQALTSAGNQIDQRKALLRETNSDTLRHKLLFSLYLHYNEINVDSAISYTNQIIELSESKFSPILLARIHTLNAYNYYSRELYQGCYKSLLLGREVLEKNITAPLNQYELNHLKVGNSKQAYHSVKGLNARIFGLLFKKTNNDELSIQNYLEALQQYDLAGLDSDIAEIKMNIGQFYLERKNYEQAKLYLEASMEDYQSVRDKKYLGAVYGDLANIKVAENSIEAAKDLYDKAIEHNTQYKIYTALINDQIDKGQLLYSLEQYEEAKHIVQQAIQLGLKHNLIRRISRAYELYGKIDMAMGNHNSANVSLIKAATIKDSMQHKATKNTAQFYNAILNDNIKNAEERVRLLSAEAKENIIILFLGFLLSSIIGLLLYRNNRQKQKSNEQLNHTLTNLQSTQAQLIHSEKMASLGELTAGIAHEIQNPLNFVNNFSDISGEMIDEALEEMDNDPAEAKEILSDLKGNLVKISHHGGRASSIVKGMLDHSRASSGEKTPTDINALCDEYLRLSYHGLKAKDKSFNASLETDFDESLPMINVVSQDIGRVLLNILNNAFFAVNEKIKKSRVANYNAKVVIKTKAISPSGGGSRGGLGKESADALSGIKITITDNGTGMSQETIDKVFQPFYTTKPTGQGTGLGMSISYDIVTKGHGGTLSVESTKGQGSTFIIVFPKGN